MKHKTLHPENVRLVYRCRNCGEEAAFAIDAVEDPPKHWTAKHYIEHIAWAYLNKRGLSHHLHRCSSKESDIGIMDMVRVYLKQPITASASTLEVDGNPLREYYEQSVAEDVLNNTPVWP